MRTVDSAPFTSTIQQTHIELRCIYLPAEFVSKFDIKHHVKHDILIEDSNPSETAGTLQVTNLIAGLAKMYRAYDLEIGDKIGLAYEDGTIIVVPPPQRLKTSVTVTQTTTQQPATGHGSATGVASDLNDKTVFSRQKLRHVHIPEFAPANLTGWTPETETDVFLVFGMLSEYTDFRYCCGVSQELVDKLNYKAGTKPDAILIDRASSEYLMAEFKVYSSDFVSNHKRDDVDVLVCWIDDATNKGELPPRVVALKDLREKAVKTGEIPLNELA